MSEHDNMLVRPGVSAAENNTVPVPINSIVINQQHVGAVHLDFGNAYLQIRLSTLGTDPGYAAHSTACPAGRARSTHLEAGTFRVVYIPRLEVCAPVCDEAPVVVVVFGRHLRRCVMVRLIDTHNLQQRTMHHHNTIHAIAVAALGAITSAPTVPNMQQQGLGFLSA